MNKFLALISSMVFAVLITSCAESTTATNGTAPATSQPRLDYRNSKADYVVLNFFDMYCIHCQKDAKHVNVLYEKLRQNSGSKVDFYGVGWNNTPMEVEMYRKRYDVKYPLIADKSRSISSRFGKVRTPLLVVLKKEGGSWKEKLRIQKIKGKQDQFIGKMDL